MTSKAVLNQIVQAIKSEDELNGAVIGFCGNGMCQTLDEGNTNSINYATKIIIIEETNVAVTSTVDSAPDPAIAGASTKPKEVVKPNFVSNRSRFGSELAGASLSCGVAIVSGLGVVGGAAAEVPTLGGSTVVLVAGWVGFAASALQCSNGIARLYLIADSPDDNTLQLLDDDDTYNAICLIVDGVGIVSAVATLPNSVRQLSAVLRRTSALRGVNLAQLSKAERAAVTADAIVEASKTDEGAKAVRAALQDAGLKENQIKNAIKIGAHSYRQSRAVFAALSKETAMRLNGNVLSILSGAVGMGASASPSSAVGSASGSLQWVIVHAINL